jgi:IclR family transcriptional regulator, pca regulon regulatory protein
MPSAATPPPQRRDLIAGLEKGLAVIDAFDPLHPRLGIVEVATRCGLSRAAARRYLITLAHLGYVISSDGKTYALTAKLLRLGQSYMRSAELPRIVQPELNRLASSLKEASSAGVLDGNDVICIAATSLGRIVSATLQPATRVPAYCTANGRVLLAALPTAQAEAWLVRQTLAALTPHTLTRPDKLRSEINRVRRQGYALVDQELELGLRTLAVPLRNLGGEVVAAINVSVHAASVSSERLIDVCLPALQQTQASLRSLL